MVEALDAATVVPLARSFLDSHVSMRDDFEISCAELDAAVETAVEAGALGARMTGGGFGGSAIALVPAERLEAVARAIDAAFAARRLPGAAAHLLATPVGRGGRRPRAALRRRSGRRDADPALAERLDEQRVVLADPVGVGRSRSRSPRP